MQDISNQDQYAYPASSQQRFPWGCVVGGCLTVVLLGIISIVAVFYFIWNSYNQQISRYTSETPQELPVVEASAEEVAEIEAKLERFQRSIDRIPNDSEENTNSPSASAPVPSNSDTSESDFESEEDSRISEQEATKPEGLVLTADEINTLISSNQNLKGRVYVSIGEGQVTADVSIPTDAIPGANGRFFNGSVTLDVSLEEGVLIVTVNAAKVNDENVP
jgi:hypothetical protein